MHPPCSRGSGKPPRYVTRVDWPSSAIRLYLSSFTDGRADTIACESEASLRDQCQHLAEERVCFSVGGQGVWASPADLMAHLQQDGQMPISFLQIAWTGRDEWVVHEIIPGVQQWDITPIQQLLGNPPLHWTAAAG